MYSRWRWNWSLTWMLKMMKKMNALIDWEMLKRRIIMLLKVAINEFGWRKKLSALSNSIVEINLNHVKQQPWRIEIELNIGIKLFIWNAMTLVYSVSLQMKREQLDSILFYSLKYFEIEFHFQEPLA